MTYYTNEALMAMAIASMPALIGVYVYFIKQNYKVALALLLISGFLLRLLMAAIDPYLQDWDERFHALVAKNLMDYPLKPMLRLNPIVPYNAADWCCNHVWLHKQPLFLWQMALAMKIFGVSELAMRLPSVIMGTISIAMVADIAHYWTRNKTIAFVAAILSAFSYYQLELTAGHFVLEQNDVAFSFYITASIWAFIRYLKSDYDIKWALLVGIFAGCAVLNKWLTGLLLLGSWALYLLVTPNRKNYKAWLHLLAAFVASLMVFMPWQWYITHQFPLESIIVYEHNRRHIFEIVENHGGTIWFHFVQMQTIYGKYLLFFIPLGIYRLLSKKNLDRPLSLALFAAIMAVYAFFSLVVATKMPSFAYPINTLIWIIIASGLLQAGEWLKKIPQIAYIYTIITIFIAVYTLKPWQIAASRDLNNEARNKKINNTQIYKNIHKNSAIKHRVIINCKEFEDTELMFYQNINAYHWYPTEKVVDSLLHKGYKFAAFASHNNQILPDYITNNKDIIIINDSIQ